MKLAVWFELSVNWIHHFDITKYWMKQYSDKDSGEIKWRARGYRLATSLIIPFELDDHVLQLGICYWHTVNLKALKPPSPLWLHLRDVARYLRQISFTIIRAIKYLIYLSSTVLKRLPASYKDGLSMNCSVIMYRKDRETSSTSFQETSSGLRNLIRKFSEILRCEVPFYFPWYKENRYNQLHFRTLLFYSNWMGFLSFSFCLYDIKRSLLCLGLTVHSLSIFTSISYSLSAQNEARMRNSIFIPRFGTSYRNNNSNRLNVEHRVLWYYLLLSWLMNRKKIKLKLGFSNGTPSFYYILILILTVSRLAENDVITTETKIRFFVRELRFVFYRFVYLMHKLHFQNSRRWNYPKWLLRRKLHSQIILLSGGVLIFTEL